MRKPFIPAPKIVYRIGDTIRTMHGLGTIFRVHPFGTVDVLIADRAYRVTGLPVYDLNRK